MFYSDPIASAFADYEERKNSFPNYFKGWKMLLTKVKEDAFISNIVTCNQVKDLDSSDSHFCLSMKTTSFSEEIKHVAP